MEFNDRVIKWLLEEDNPPVRYLTLKYLLKQPKQAEKARERLMDYSVTRGILKHIPEILKNDKRAYWKYKGKYWQLIFLGQFLADKGDQSVSMLAENIMANRNWIWKFGGQCLAANILAALRRIGFTGHPQVLGETEGLAKAIIANEGIQCEVMDYSLLPHCYMTIPKVLLCFAEIPAQDRSLEVRRAIDILVQSLLDHNIYMYIPGNRREWQKILASAPKAKELPKGKTVKGWVKTEKEKFLKTYGIGGRDEKKGWHKYGFPLHYNSDLLEALFALARLKIPRVSQLEMALMEVKEKMTAEGKWTMENSLNGKMFVDVEQKGKPSKWITFRALRVLNHFNVK